MSRVTASLITRDEQAHIGPCLESVRSIADEIIVVDTGSTDQTPDIAREHGAKVLHVPWCDDFAFVRNAGLDQASGDWILYVDADERVTRTGELEPVLEDHVAIAAQVQFRASSKLTPYREYRLFRNRSDIRFRGAIHETMVPDVRALVDRGEGVVVDAPLAFEHLGYEGDIAHKHRRNLPLLRRAVAEDPERIYLWFTLGEATLGLGDARGAEEAWRRGLRVLQRRGTDPGDVLIYASLLDLYLSEASVDVPDASELLEQLTRRHPDDPLTFWWKARCLASEGRFAEARANLENILAFGPDGPSHGKLGYDRQLFRSFAWGLLGTCWLSEGDPERALAWLRRAEDEKPNDLELRTKRALAEGALRSRS